MRAALEAACLLLLLLLLAPIINTNHAQMSGGKKLGGLVSSESQTVGAQTSNRQTAVDKRRKTNAGTQSLRTQLTTIDSRVVMDPHLICMKNRKRRGKLADICRKESSLLVEVSRGVNMGVEECGFQFRSRRWNCTTIRKSMRKVLMKDTRETGFVNAITAAGITYAITRACTNGDLVQCSCEKAGRARRKGKRTTNPASLMPSAPPFTASGDGTSTTDFKWEGCGDNIRYGLKKSRVFMDARMKKQNTNLKTLIKLHNNNAGRLAIKNYMRPDCKCHGLSGSCTVKTCWMKMPPFREVGSRLKDKFDGASKVIAANDGKKFTPEESSIKVPEKPDLVYTEDSPEFCEPDARTGSLGTQGRECNVTSQGIDGCDILCCSRGYNTTFITDQVHCKCKFSWCCYVSCEVCKQKRELFTCV